MKRQVKNQFVLRFPAKSVNEGFSRSTAAMFAAQLDPTLEEVNDLKSAVSEAVTNAIVHGYRDTLGEITMTVRLLEPNIVEVTVKDKGCGIPDIGQARQPLFTTGGADRSGMGFTIMESFTDGLRVRSAPGKGTTVTLRKVMSLRTAP